MSKASLSLDAQLTVELELWISDIVVVGLVGV